MQKDKMLEMLKEKVHNCTKCPELMASRTKIIFGQGNPNTKVFFLGESPGRTEDKEGVPFCGQAGQLLNNIIKTCGWQREEVYITNSVYCHPDNNRNPQPEELNNCRSYLELQLKIINPKIIVCLGNVAAQHLLKTTEVVSKLRGSWHEYNKIKVRVTYHPAFLLRNPDKKKECWEDMKTVIKELKS